VTRFHFDPSDFSIPGLRDLHLRWALLPDDAVRSAVIVELQYLAFHRFLLGSLSFIAEVESGTVSGKIDHSVRAGAVKAAVSLAASVAEAALRCHAERRGFKLPTNPRHRTFGAVLSAWDSAGQLECGAIWDDLQRLLDHRNLIHLYKGAEESRNWRDVLHAENSLLEAADRVLAQLPTIRSP
jgi:hypothetical protein